MSDYIYEFPVLTNNVLTPDYRGGIPFRSYGAIVDNYSQLWLYLPDAGRFVPPGTHNATVRLPGTTQANLSWRPPPTVTQPTPSSGGVAVIRWVDAEVPDSAGTPVVNPSQVVSVIGSFKVASGSSGNQTSATFTAPPGTVGVRVIKKMDPGVAHNLSLTNGTATISWGAAKNSPSVWDFPFDWTTDASLQIIIDFGSGVSSAVGMWNIEVWTLPLVLTVTNSPNSYPATTFIAGSPTPIGDGTTETPDRGSAPMPVQVIPSGIVGSGANFGNQQLKLARIATAIVAGTAQTIVTHSGTTSIYVKRFHLSFDTAQANVVQLQDSTPTVYADFDNLAVGQLIETDFEGTAVTASGKDLQLNNAIGPNITVRGFVLYWQF